MQGRTNVTGMVLDALVATHEIWAGPMEIEEDLIPNLQFSRNLNQEEEETESREPSFRTSELPGSTKIVITPTKIEKKEEMKEEFVTPEDATFEFVTPMGDSTVYKKEDKTESKIEKEEFAPPPKLHLDQSWEEELLPMEEPPADEPVMVSLPTEKNDELQENLKNGKSRKKSL